MHRTRFKYSQLLFVFLICFLFTKTIQSQSYIFTPSTYFVAMVDTSQLNFDGIEIKNTGSQNLNLTWELVSKDTLIDSEFDLCNSGICFNTLPISGAMPTLAPGTIGWLKLHMFSGRIMGVNTIKYVLKNGINQIDTLTFVINVGNVTPIKELKNVKDNVILYPNPSSAETAIQLNLSEASETSISLLNATGQCIYKTSSEYSVGNNLIFLDTKKYPSGIYTITIITKNGIINKKLVVTK